MKSRLNSWFAVHMMHDLLANEDQLFHFKAKILNAQNRHPNLTLKLENKTVMQMDFPVDLHYVTTGTGRFHGLTTNQLAQLKNCNAELAGRSDQVAMAFPISSLGFAMRRL